MPSMRLQSEADSVVARPDDPGCPRSPELGRTFSRWWGRDHRRGIAGKRVSSLRQHFWRLAAVLPRFPDNQVSGGRAKWQDPFRAMGNPSLELRVRALRDPFAAFSQVRPRPCLSVTKRQKQTPRLRWESQPKNKSGFRFPPPGNYGSGRNAVKGRDERRCAAPLTAFLPPGISLSRFALTRGIVVIDSMSDESYSKTASDVMAGSASGARVVCQGRRRRRARELRRR